MKYSIIFSLLAGTALAKHKKGGYIPAPVIPVAPIVPRQVAIPERHVECPPGFVLSGDMCTATEFSAPVPLCPPGTVDQGGRCSSSSPARWSCAPGFTMNGRDCTRALTEPASPYCEGSWMLAGNSCEQSIPLPPTCPSGFSQGKGGCTQFSPRLSECPQGYNRQGHECVRQHAFEKVPYCENGWDLQGHQCTQQIPVAPRCPPSFNQDGKGCSKLAPRLSRCPPHFSQTGNGCSKQHTFPKQPVCENPEFTLEGNSCARYEPVAPFCPPGFSQSKGGCKQETAPLTRCPDGFYQTGNGCLKTIPLPKVPQCDLSFSLVGDRCEKHVSVPSYPSCSVGTLQGNQCAISHSAPAMRSCPPGSSLSGNLCLSSEAYDCSTTSFRTECDDVVQPIVAAPLPIYAGKGKGKFHHRELKGKKKRGFVAPIPAPLPAPIRPCHSIPVHEPRTCNRDVTLPARLECPHGGELRGDSCFSLELVQAELIQPAPRLVTVAADYVCPAGGCSISENAPLIPYCENGWTFSHNMCYRTAELVMPPPRKISLPATFVCTGGNGPNCVEIEQAPLLYYCQDGYVDTGDSCLLTADLIYPPPRVESRPAQMQCTGGQGPNCVQIENAPLNYFCQSGWTDAGDQCMRSAPLVHHTPRVERRPANYNCQMGWELRGAICYSSESFPATPECPQGWDMAGDSCLSYVAPSMVCRTGTQTPEGCALTRTQPAIITVTHRYEAQPIVAPIIQAAPVLYGGKKGGKFFKGKH